MTNHADVQPSYLARWLDDPDGGGRFTSQRDLIRAHPTNCPSLEHAWLPRKGGVSCISDLMECDSCQITFFWDGIVDAFEDCPESHHWLCRCCKPDTCGCSSTETGDAR